MGGAVDADCQTADHDDTPGREPLRQRVRNLQADPGRPPGAHDRDRRRCQACKASSEEQQMRRIGNCLQQCGELSVRPAQHTDSRLRQAFDLLLRALEQAAGAALTHQRQEHFMWLFAPLQRLFEPPA